MGNLVDLTGRRFGKLTAIFRSGTSRAGKVTWLCQCACGVEKIVISGNLVNGFSKSCGCNQIRLARLRGRERIKHGHARDGKLTQEYNSWMAMHKRCRQPTTRDFEHYGGRGITVCERWKEFANFLKDMGPKPTPSHSIDRINVNGNYELANCRWATTKEQAGNKRPRARAEDRNIQIR